MSPTRLLMVAAALTLSASGAFAQEVIYRETFGATVDQTSLTTVGWQGWSGNTTAGVQATEGGFIGRGALSNTTGSPTNVSNVNAGTSVSSTTGIGFVASGNGNNDIFAFTNEYVIDRSLYNVTSFTWWAASRYATGSDFQHVAIQIGGVWYASNNPIVPVAIGTGTNFAAQAVQVTTSFTTTGSDWRTINFTAPVSPATVGAPLSLGAVLASSLPSGNITGFGLYVEIGDQGGATPNDEASRFDTFTVLANPVATGVVPEPSALALVATGILPGIAALRLRRRRSA